MQSFSSLPRDSASTVYSGELKGTSASFGVGRPSMRPPVPPFPRFYGRRAKLFPSPIPELDWSANGHSAESSGGQNKRERQQKGKDGLTFFCSWDEAAGGKTAAAQNGMGSEL